MNIVFIWLLESAFIFLSWCLADVTGASQKVSPYKAYMCTLLGTSVVADNLSCWNMIGSNPKLLAPGTCKNAWEKTTHHMHSFYTIHLIFTNVFYLHYISHQKKIQYEHLSGSTVNISSKIAEKTWKCFFMKNVFPTDARLKKIDFYFPLYFFLSKI